MQLFYLGFIILPNLSKEVSNEREDSPFYKESGRLSFRLKSYPDPNLEKDVFLLPSQERRRRASPEGEI